MFVRGTGTYSNLIGAGFEDAWSATHPREPGNTWGHDADLLNTTVSPIGLYHDSYSRSELDEWLMDR